MFDMCIIFVFLIVCVGSMKTKVLRKIFGSTHENITGEWKELYNAKLHNFCSFLIFRLMGSRRMRCFETYTV